MAASPESPMQSIVLFPLRTGGVLTINTQQCSGIELRPGSAPQTAGAVTYIRLNGQPQSHEVAADIRTVLQSLWGVPAVTAYATLLAPEAAPAAG